MVGKAESAKTQCKKKHARGARATKIKIRLTSSMLVHTPVIPRLLKSLST